MVVLNRNTDCFPKLCWPTKLRDGDAACFLVGNYLLLVGLDSFDYFSCSSCFDQTELNF